MTYTKTQNVICSGDLKQAALYFDRVIPLCFRQIRGGGKNKKSLEHLPDDRKITKVSDVGIIVEIPEEIPSVAFVDIVYGSDKNREYSRFATEFLDFFDIWAEFHRSVKQFREDSPLSSVDDTYEDLTLAYLKDKRDVFGVSIREEFRVITESCV